MRRTTEKKLKMFLLCAVLGTGLLFSAPKQSMAATTAQYEYDMAGEGETVYLGVVNRSVLNVRSGVGTDYPIVKDAEGKDVTLALKDEIAILSRKYNGDDIWYQVSFLREGELIKGYVFGEYVDRKTDVITPIATPTPVVTPTPVPTLKPTKEPVKPTEAPTATVAPTPVPEKKDGGNGTLIAIMVIVLIAGGAGILWYLKVGTGRFADHEEEDEQEQTQRRSMRGPLSADGTPIRTTRRRNEDDEEEPGAYRVRREKQDEASLLADKERARRMNEEMIRQYRNGEGAQDEEELKQIAASLKEKEVLKEEIDGLHIGDMVFHEYFGKGIVRDNSDVNVIEISFGQDVRFLNKSACAKKRLLRKL